MEIPQRDVRRKKVEAAGASNVTSCRNADQLVPSGMETSDQEEGPRSGLCCNTKVLDGISQERRTLSPEEAMPKSGSGLVWET